MRKYVVFIIGVTILIAVVYCEIKQNNIEEKTTHKITTYNLVGYKATFPFYLEKIDFPDTTKYDVIEHNVAIKFTEVINQLLETKVGKTEYDFIQKIRNEIKVNPLNTIILEDSSNTFYMLILDRIPSIDFITILIAKDNSTNKILHNSVQISFDALYHFDENKKIKFIPTNLKTTFKISTPEVIRIKDNHYKISRLYHNGTVNGVQTFELRIKNNTIDTFNTQLKMFMN